MVETQTFPKETQWWWRTAVLRGLAGVRLLSHGDWGTVLKHLQRDTELCYVVFTLLQVAQSSSKTTELNQHIMYMLF